LAKLIDLSWRLPKSWKAV